MRIYLMIVWIGTMSSVGVFAQSTLLYPWQHGTVIHQKSVTDIPLPAGYARMTSPDTSFHHWLQHLPLKSGDHKVRLFDGSLKANQRAQYAIIDIDVGSRDLQQCADAIIRLRAEYLFARQRYDEIAFNFTSGDRARFIDWAQGRRPVVRGNTVTWHNRARPDSSYVNFRRYLTTVFIYAGSYSLAKELRPVADSRTLQIGDVFLQGGFPGHGVIVVDMARHPATGFTIFLLAQSYMPAQDVHVLHNPANLALSPWYVLNTSGPLITPEWRFAWTDLMRFDPP